MTGDSAKRAAAVAAVERVRDGMRLGLGTGSTVAEFLEVLADADLDVAGVPTSRATADHARQRGIRLLDPDDVERLDLAVDGADELDATLCLTKGGGGALLREKVVATMADHFVVIATRDKLVERLGDRFPLPLEVVPFALAPVRRVLERRGYEVTARDNGGFRTDNGNAILNCRLPGGIDDPGAEDLALSCIPGVVCCGLFVGLADTALLGDESGTVVELTAADRVPVD
ncbi:MAG: ribose-5-phosphate isomerase RpiA [Nitriliruptoraceae bacterium]